VVLAFWAILLGVVDATALRWWYLTLTAWLHQREADTLAYLLQENRTLRAQFGGRPLRLTDDQRRRLAVLGHRLGRARLQRVATLVTPDTILRWHRRLVAHKWTYRRRGRGRTAVLREIQTLVIRMAQENPTWGYTRMQGALKVVGHRVGRTTIARILKAHGLPPVPQRPTSWHTFLQAHWGAIASADFFTTEVWTAKGLVTYYTLFVLDLASRRVHVVDSTAHPHALFMEQMARTLVFADDGPLAHHRVLICDRDAKWSQAVRGHLGQAGLTVVQTPWRAPNANAYAERFVRSIKQECLDRLVPLGERHLREAVAEYVAHYNGERPHQGRGNELLEPARPSRPDGPIRRRPRRGGLLNYYVRAA
jgi:transposase InsO family protein